MSYAVGIDLGTTYTAAAIARGDRAEAVNLGNRSAVVPSVIFLRDDRTVLVGEAAIRRAAAEPGRVAREFKRRIGDPVPVLLGGVPFSAEALMAKMLRWTVDAVTEREGGPPARVAVTHPANWGPYKLDLLTQAVRLAEVKVDRYVSEPEAAAVAYASTERLAPRAQVAVYDLGGGTFDTCVLRKREVGFEVLGDPDGIERFGGIDFDAAVLAHVTGMLGGALEVVDPADPAAAAGLARLRSDCVDAKEALSSDIDASVAVLLPGLQTEVRITRAEFEALIRPALGETIAALRRALRSAGVAPSDLDAVLLVGGSSRIPLVAELVSAELGRPVAVDAHPKHVVAVGAARTAAGALARPAAPVPAPPTVRAPVAVPVTVGVPAHAAPSPVRAGLPQAAPPPPPAPLGYPAAAAAPAPPVLPGGPPRDLRGTGPAASSPPAGGPAPRRGRRRGLLIGTAAVVVLAGAGTAVLLLRGGATGGATDCPGVDGRAVCITNVQLSGETILAEFTGRGVQLASPVSGSFPDGSLHPVFFFQGLDPASGRVWGARSPFGGPNAAGLTGFGTSDAPSSGASLCVLLQDAQGRVLQGSGNCASLPGQG